MDPSPTVLLITNPEHGQANVHLATAYELALAGANIHFLSFPPLKSRISCLQDVVHRRASRTGRKTFGSINFHAIRVEPAFFGAHSVESMMHPCGVSGAVESYKRFDRLLFGWSQEDYLAVIKEARETIESTKPDLVVVDTLFFAAQDACKLADQPYMVLSPTGLKETVTDLQPYMAAIWKYPMLSSGFPYPLEWWQIPLNIYLRIQLILQFVNSLNMRRLVALRKSLGINDAHQFFAGTGTKFICPALPEIDFPFAFIPEDMLLCGPIIVPFDPLEERDPELATWLNNGPTVMVNLGSHVRADEKIAREMVSAFRILLDFHDRKGGSSKMQVLWKAKANGDIQRVIDDIIGKEIKEGRVKVVAWLDAEPVSVLQHPNVVCTVHHGGANSFYEGVWCGMPHVVLPVWGDTYDYARRAEFLEIGIFANQTCSPGVCAEELGGALVRVTGEGTEATKFRTSAKRLREVCRAKGNGREVAAAVILGMVTSTSSRTVG